MVTGTMIKARTIFQLVTIQPKPLIRLTSSSTSLTVTTAIVKARMTTIKVTSIRKGIATGLLAVFPYFAQLAAVVPDTLSPPAISNRNTRVAVTTEYACVTCFTLALLSSLRCTVRWLRLMRAIMRSFEQYLH